MIYIYMYMYRMHIYHISNTCDIIDCKNLHIYDRTMNVCIMTIVTLYVCIAMWFEVMFSGMMRCRMGHAMWIHDRNFTRTSPYLWQTNIAVEIEWFTYSWFTYYTCWFTEAILVDWRVLVMEGTQKWWVFVSNYVRFDWSGLVGLR